MTLSPDSALLRIRHVTGFNYAGLATSSYNEARMTPVTSPRQQPTSSSLRIFPAAIQSTYRDYFDTIVTTFDLHEPHERLEVIAEASVEVVAEAPAVEGLTRADLVAPDVVDQMTEYLAPTTRTTLSSAVLEAVGRPLAGAQVVGEVARDVVDAVRERVTYTRGSTEVSSTAQEVWDQGQGVCQDLSHVTISLLRSLGVPARYVSGYFHPNPEARPGEEVVGESHAWLEYFCGQWVGIDPTNGGGIGLHHVVVAKGREYGDVPPLKGIYHGDPSSALGVAVSITRLR